MRVYSNDRRWWRVGRRWWAFRPRAHPWLDLLTDVARWLDNPVTFLIAAAAAVLAIPLLIWLVVQWLVCLIATPVALLIRAWGGPWPVIAEALDEDWGEFRGAGDGWEGSGQLRDQVADEIRSSGAPRSLQPPRRFEQHLAAPPGPVPYAARLFGKRGTS